MEKIRTNRNGSSIISVIVAFALLMIAIAMLYTAMTASMNLMARARKVDEQTYEVMSEFYESYQADAGTTGNIELKPSGGTAYQQITVHGYLKQDDGNGIYYYQLPASQGAQTS